MTYKDNVTNVDSTKSINNFGWCNVRKLLVGKVYGRKGKIRLIVLIIKSKYLKKKINNFFTRLTSLWLSILIRKKTNNNFKILSKVFNNGSKSCLFLELMDLLSTLSHYWKIWLLRKKSTCQILTISIINCLNLISSSSLRPMKKLSWCKRIFSILVHYNQRFMWKLERYLTLCTIISIHTIIISIGLHFHNLWLDFCKNMKSALPRWKCKLVKNQWQVKRNLLFWWIFLIKNSPILGNVICLEASFYKNMPWIKFISSLIVEMILMVVQHLLMDLAQLIL